MGGEQAIAAMGSDRRIRAVVGEGVTGMQVADHGWLPHGIDGALTRGMEWVQYTAAGLLSGAPRPMPLQDAIRAAAGPARLRPDTDPQPGRMRLAGFLPRLRSFEWADVQGPPDGAQAAKALRATLWGSAHPWRVLGNTATAAWLTWRRHRQ